DIMDEKAALMAEESSNWRTEDITMTDAPELTRESDDRKENVNPKKDGKVQNADAGANPRGVSPSTPVQPSTDTATPTYSKNYQNVTPKSTYNKQQASLSRRLAMANLPPITPITTRAKERAAAEAGYDVNNPYGRLPGDPQSAATTPIDLDTNTDYIALSSTLELLTSQREIASEDIAKLQKLKSSALEDPDTFISRLKRDGKVEGAPKMQSIVRAPIVRWNKYGISNQNLEKEIEKGVVNRDTRFGAVRIFGQPQGQRKASA
ncbi:hypothetical protein V1511DRAFT_449087, partial [Dipodascopsis uninucleata]